jgi:tetratricopeptide (TPR) repeat protein
MGRFDESLAESKSCIQLDPLDPSMVVHLGEHYHFARQHDQAIDQLRKAIQGDANRYRAHDNLGRAYEQKGMYSQALAAFDRAVKTSQEGAATEASRAAGLAAAGRRDEALRIVNRLKSGSAMYVPAYGLAEVFAVLGDTEEAFEWLEKAYSERSSSLAYIKVEPRLDRLRGDPRFKKLLLLMRL